MKHKGLNQLLCAATVNGRFREALLRDPAQAIARGYYDHQFNLTPEERSIVVGIQAQRLEDFAAQVYGWIYNGGNGHRAAGLNDNGYKDVGLNGKGWNGHSKNGHGYLPEALPLTEPAVEILAKVPVPA